MEHHNTQSYQVTLISDQQFFFSHCARHRHSHTHADGLD